MVSLPVPVHCHPGAWGRSGCPPTLCPTGSLCLSWWSHLPVEPTQPSLSSYAVEDNRWGLFQCAICQWWPSVWSGKVRIKSSLSLPCSPIICHIMLERSPGTSVSNTIKIVLWPTSMIKSLVDQYRAIKVVQLSHHCLQPSAVYSVPPFPHCQMFCFEEASLFLWCSDSVLYEWDIAAGTCLRSLTGHSRPITAVWVSHNNQLE